MTSKTSSHPPTYSLEKIHLHFDRSHYPAGDTIWFKAYLVDEVNQLTEHSAILYVALINDRGETLQTTKVPMLAGLGWGDIPLDIQLPAGQYHVVAYTSWLRNFGEDFFFSKVIQVDDLAGKQIAVNSRVVRTGPEREWQLSYKDLRGQPLTGRRIDYTIDRKGGEPANGKVITDTAGLVKIMAGDSGAVLTTVLDTDSGPVSRTFRLPGTEMPVDVQFFPEGGEMVTNLPGRIGIKITGDDGLGRNVSGYITDQNQSRITSFDTGFGGMGVFSLNPQPGGRYTAHILLEDNRLLSFPLPQSRESGLAMTISSEPNSIVARIKGSPDKEGSLVNLEAYAGGTRLAGIRETIRPPQLLIRIPKTVLPAGVIRLTLSDGNDGPVAERLVFVGQTDELNIGITGHQGSFTKMQEVSGRLKVSDQAGKQVLGSFSLAITDESRVMHDEEAEFGIQSNLLLSAGLKGNVENPNYYFTDVTDEKRRQLDILLMTQGWRKFRPLIPAGIPPFNTEKSLRISGRVLTPLRSAASASTVTLLVGNAGAFTSKTNDHGEFAFDSLYFEGRTRLNFSAQNVRGRSAVNISLDPLPDTPVFKRRSFPSGAPVVTDSILLSHTEDAEIKKWQRLAEIGKMQLLEEVKVTAQRVRQIRESVNINASPALYTLTEKHFDQYTNMQDALHLKVPSLEFRGRKLLFRGDSIQPFINGAPAPHGFDVRDLHIGDLAGIEVLTGPQASVYGARSVLFITTKAGDPKIYTPMGHASVTVDGYRFERQFYSPRFDLPEKRQLPDLRKTIYWNPNLLTVDGLSQEFSFFTGDKSGRYRFVIEGVDEYGRLVRRVFSRTVN